jgi:hypothetical protein
MVISCDGANLFLVANTCFYYGSDLIYFFADTTIRIAASESLMAGAARRFEVRPAALFNSNEQALDIALATQFLKRLLHLLNYTVCGRGVALLLTGQISGNGADEHIEGTFFTL